MLSFSFLETTRPIWQTQTPNLERQKPSERNCINKDKTQPENLFKDLPQYVRTVLLSAGRNKKNEN
jgi:hypothetical protein